MVNITMRMGVCRDFPQKTSGFERGKKHPPLPDVRFHPHRKSLSFPAQKDISFYDLRNI
jgi:hypothetical protein